MCYTVKYQYCPRKGTGISNTNESGHRKAEIEVNTIEDKNRDEEDKAKKKHSEREGLKGLKKKEGQTLRQCKKEKEEAEHKPSLCPN